MNKAEYRSRRRRIDAALEAIAAEMNQLDAQPLNVDLQHRYDDLNGRLDATVVEIVTLESARLRGIRSKP